MDWFTGCTHFGHDKIRTLSNRPFDNVDDMNKMMLENINSRVMPGDNLWILGDFCFGGFDANRSFLDQIVCKSRTLILGNHDKLSMTQYKRLGLMVYHYKTLKRVIDGKPKKIALFHYPIDEWDGFFRGSWHLHSHTHGNINIGPNGRTKKGHPRIDVGVDSHNFCPLSLEEISNIFSEGV